MARGRHTKVHPPPVLDPPAARAGTSPQVSSERDEATGGLLRHENPLLITCVGVGHDLDLLPHFLRHYLDLGVQPERVRPVLNATASDARHLERAEAILADYGVTAAEIWTEPYTSDGMWAKRREVQLREVEPEDWLLSADVDELHEYPEPLSTFLARCERMGVNCVQGVFIDRLASGGHLAPVMAEPALADQFPVHADVIWSLFGRGAHHNRGGTVKLMAVHGHILPGRGGHDAQRGQPARYLYSHPLSGFTGLERPAFRFAVPTRVNHFHWTQSLPERLQRRLDTPGVSPAGREYGQKQLDHLAAHGGVALPPASRPEVNDGDWIRRMRRMRMEGQARTLVRVVRKRVRALTGQAP